MTMLVLFSDVELFPSHSMAIDILVENETSVEESAADE